MISKHRMASWLIFSFFMLIGWVMSSPVLRAQDITVTSANPNMADQGTVSLDVMIGGSGFKKGAKAQWFITGTTNPGGITVNSTAFVNPNTLVANITVAADAQTDLKFDVAVTSGGRTGKGIELFSVSSSTNGATCTTYNVTSILSDLDSNSAPLQYQSDGLGPYVTSNRKGDAVSSIIQKSCSWALDTTGSKTRGIVVTLAYPFASNPPPPFVGPQVIKGVFHTTCQNDPASNGLNFGTMTFTGQTMVCPLVLPFNYNGVYYKLSLAPQKWPGTSYMQVTCSGSTGGRCNSWTAAPDPATSVLNTATNQVSGVAELFITDSTGTVTGTALGTYLVSFSFLIHK